MTTKGIIDRLEGDCAVVEIAGVMKTVKRCNIPAEAREGDVIILEEAKWKIDRPATDKLKQEIQKLAEELWK